MFHKPWAKGQYNRSFPYANKKQPQSSDNSNKLGTPYCRYIIYNPFSSTILLQQQRIGYTLLQVHPLQPFLVHDPPTTTTTKVHTTAGHNLQPFHVHNPPTTTTKRVHTTTGTSFPTLSHPIHTYIHTAAYYSSHLVGAVTRTPISFSRSRPGNPHIASGDKRNRPQRRNASSLLLQLPSFPPLCPCSGITFRHRAALTTTAAAASFNVGVHIHHRRGRSRGRRQRKPPREVRVLFRLRALEKKGMGGTGSFVKK